MTVQGTTYTVRPLKLKILGEFEKWLRGQEQLDYVSFHALFFKVGRPIQAVERAKAMAQIIARPFGFSDVAQAVYSVRGAVWMLARILCVDDQPIGEETVNDWSSGVVMDAVSDMLLQSGFTDADEVVESVSDEAAASIDEADAADPTESAP